MHTPSSSFTTPRTLEFVLVTTANWLPAHLLIRWLTPPTGGRPHRPRCGHCFWCLEATKVQ